MSHDQTMDSQNLLIALQQLSLDDRKSILALQTMQSATLSAPLQAILAAASTALGQTLSPRQLQEFIIEIQHLSNEGLGQSNNWLQLCQTYLTATSTKEAEFPHESSALTGVQILLVDDNQQRRETFQTYLATLGLICTSVTFEHALSTLQKSLQADVTYQMIIICGEHFDHHAAYLGRTIKANSLYQHIMPVLALVSEKPLDFEIERALFSGFNCVLNQTVATDFSKKLIASWRGWLSKATFKQNAVKQACILVVEDEPIAQFSAQRQLQALGFAVDIAPDGQTALQLFIDKNYALIFMDIGLPDMSGLEVTAEIRRREHDKITTPIIGLTVSALAEDEEQGLKLGMNDYLVKPLLPNRLQAVLQKWLKP